MSDTLERLLGSQLITPLSYHFARFLADSCQQPADGLLAQSAALVSHANQQGDICVDLRQQAGKALFSRAGVAPVEGPVAPELNHWIRQLQQLPGVGCPGEIAPLILDRQRLYLGRLWQHEQRVLEAITQRLGPVAEIDPAVLGSGLQRLFPAPPAVDKDATVDWQKIATAVAVTRRFAVISGGPGTGKTTTLVKVLALLLEQQPGVQIRLAAPTGKAAARMVESIRQSSTLLEVSTAVRSAIPERASTLHRLLGYNGDRFRHRHDNPLLLDCLVIDEASMIDLTMMAHLVDTLLPQARLILLGDRDQLASVEAGSVLGDITGHGQAVRFTRQQAEWIAALTDTPVERIPHSQQAPAIADSIALLRFSYRFGNDSDIGRLAAAINNGDGETGLRQLQQTGADTQWMASAAGQINPALIDWAVAQCRNYLAADTVEQALLRFASSRILCALHEGPFGIQEINRRIGQRLRMAGLIDGGELFHGKPLMISANNYEVGLYNGDIGLLWRDQNGELQAWFDGDQGVPRKIPLATLPEHTTAWALTVHKSQGSEFDQVLLVLPDSADSPVVSRELIYTGTTRARQQVIVHASEGAFIDGCRRTVERSSGLAERLGWQSAAPSSRTRLERDRE